MFSGPNLKSASRILACARSCKHGRNSLNHTYITTKEYVKEIVDSEREHTNAKISSMADSLVSSLMNVYKKVADNSAANRSTIEEANI